MSGKIAKNIEAAVHAQLWRWVRDFGTIEIGYCHQTRSFIRVLDEGGMIWKGRRSYASLEAALADAEAGVARWPSSSASGRTGLCPTAVR